MSKLYEFFVGLETVRYTDYESDIIKEGNIYKAVPISSNELSKDSLNDDAVIIINSELEPIKLYKEFNPSTQVYLRVLNEGGNMLFFGRVGSVEFDINAGSAKVKATTLGGLMKSKIPTRTYSRNCSFELFSQGCGLNKDSHKLVLLGSECSFSKNYMSIVCSKLNEKKDGYFNGGYVSFNHQHSYITSHTGDKINLMFPLPKLDASSVISVFAGCDKTLNCCKDRFDNEKNYGGFPFVPNKNPMTQGY